MDLTIRDTVCLGQPVILTMDDWLWPTLNSSRITFSFASTFPKDGFSLWRCNASSTAACPSVVTKTHSVFLPWCENVMGITSPSSSPNSVTMAIRSYRGLVAPGVETDGTSLVVRAWTTAPICSRVFRICWDEAPSFCASCFMVRQPSHISPVTGLTNSPLLRLLTRGNWCPLELGRSRRGFPPRATAAARCTAIHSW